MSTSEISQDRAQSEYLIEKFDRVRQFTERLCTNLTPEDCCIQSMPDASPVRWHLAHTTWFFETFLLKAQPGYEVYSSDFEYLFNSYYNAVGEQYPRARRGLLSRPDFDEIMCYRRHVNECIKHWLADSSTAPSRQEAEIMEVGLQHEQQHQELILTDVKHLFSVNPLLPAYHDSVLDTPDGLSAPEEGTWASYGEGIYEVGNAAQTFCYDNECPRHRVFLNEFQLARRAVTNREYLQFIEDGGYRRPEFWLSLGWNFIQQDQVTEPLYWRKRGETWFEFTLAGLRPLWLNAPLAHLSYFEADAYARWAGARLPTEAEWEVAASEVEIAGNFADTLLCHELAFHPRPCIHPSSGQPSQLYGDVWEWTSSSYAPYPGYSPPPGALGEYNGKFMCNQYVLRGGSCATSSDHIRATYRNFFPPDARWQFSGLRLAR